MGQQKLESSLYRHHVVFPLISKAKITLEEAIPTCILESVVLCLIEELEELLCQDAIPAGQHKKKNQVRLQYLPAYLWLRSGDRPG